jgi:hypothetical protein
MKTKILKIIFPALMLFLPFITFAANAPNILALKQEDLEAGGAINIILGIAGWMMIVLGSIAVIVALWSAFLFMTGSGNEEQTTKARKTLIWAVVGVLVAIVAFSIVTFANSLLKPPAPGYSSQSQSMQISNCGGVCPSGTSCVYSEDISGFAGYSCQ